MVLPPNNLQIGIGQDVGSIHEYVTAFASRSFENDQPPYAIMSYTALTSLEGLWSSTEYGSGIQYASEALKEIGGNASALQLGLYLDDLEGAANGQRADNITTLRNYLKSLSPRKALVRIGYEFDNPGNEYDPKVYKAAFRNIATSLRNTDNIETVWHSWCFPNTWQSAKFSEWWPGSDVVDWVGLSIFQQGYGDSPLGNLQTASEIAQFGKKHSKPLIISESTPFGLGDTESPDTIWNRWFVHVIDFIHKHNIQIWCYINCNWDGQPMWKHQGWGDTRLEHYPQLAKLWATNILHLNSFSLSSQQNFDKPSTASLDDDYIDIANEQNYDDQQAGSFSSIHSGVSPFSLSTTATPTFFPQEHHGLILHKAYPRTAAAAHSSSYSFAAISIPFVIVIFFAVGAIICPPARIEQPVGSAATIFHTTPDNISSTAHEDSLDDNLDDDTFLDAIQVEEQRKSYFNRSEGTRHHRRVQFVDELA
mmetsp:Transcript_9095/g.12619  ORF Transcript_9095/g.12619 Transcript_9095/m.12619 type:complete len:479 (+) Transcript_9095:181-1617(+)|eukprot:CAMPEP_0197288510 /NCGR_PEP_ID=MMETSP0890-20130614/5599_1 /TAXON_ID=44058 ORGANISM="Aureoumbra lagunensis, Strain CCMP1510" /NCGR_SAMPLE_ID=MMETSP0890 /ASSEMBLY_ACC=CAM_ASM_000533 /LENGTH=478 /DNA_ID=CAMNT_0042759275 /DNA_START=192 /DNA_END=1628 /DNA_ORIENTATION=-